MVGVSFQIFQDRLIQREKKRLKELNASENTKKQRRGESKYEWELRTLTELMREVRPTIQQASAYSLNREIKRKGIDYQPRTNACLAHIWMDVAVAMFVFTFFFALAIL